MSIRTIILVMIAITLIELGVSLWAAPRLPEMVPSHWNTAGQIDDYSTRTQALFLLPGMTLGISLLLIFLPMIDPLRANVDRFRPVYHWVVAGFAVYLAYLHLLIILAGLGVAYNMTHALIPAIALLFFGLGFMLERTKQNWFIGIRTPWTLSSPLVWEKTHKVGGQLFKIAGLISLAGLFFRLEIALAIVLAPVIVAAFGSIVYSYFAYRREMQA
jgi:uncharacterized membrane protein